MKKLNVILEQLLKTIKYCLTDGYFKFSGRASRLEFWGFSLFITIIIDTILLYILSYFNLDKTLFKAEFLENYFYDNEITIYSVICLYTLIPLISVSFRRLHDTEKSGMWFIVWVIVAFILGLGTYIGDLEVTEFTWIWGILYFISIIGWLIYFIIIVYFFIRKGHDVDNKYGPNPLKNKSK